MIRKLWLLPLLAASAAACADNLEHLEDKEMVQLLALGQQVNLNQLQPEVEKGLSVMVYQVPVLDENDCFPESHGVCSYNYYLATSQLDDSPTTSAYRLGAYGEITGFEWVKMTEFDKAELMFQANKYSEQALSYNSALINEVSTYQLSLTPTTAILQAK